MNRERRIAWLQNLMVAINANNGTVNCAHVALRLDDILNKPELASTVSPVPTQFGKLSTNPVYTTDGTGVIKSFCADIRLLTRCVSPFTDGIVTDISGDQEVLLLDEEITIDRKKIKLIKFKRLDAIKMLRNLPRRARDGTAQGFIFYSHINKNSGHISNFFVDANDEVYFLDAQRNKRPETFVLDEPTEGFREEFFYVQCMPEEGFKLRVEKNPYEELKLEKNKMSLLTLHNPTVIHMNSIATHINELLLNNPSVDAIKAIPAHIKWLHLDNPSVDVIKAIPAHIRRLQLYNPSVDAIKAIPAHMKSLKLDNPSVNVINALPPDIHLKLENPSVNVINALPPDIHLKLENPSIAAINALPANFKGLILINPSIDVLKALPLQMRHLGLEYPSVVAIKALPIQIIELYITVNENDQSAIIEILKTRPAGFKLYNNHKLTLETKPAPAAIMVPPLTLRQPMPPPPLVVAHPVVAPPTPTLTPAYAALQAENERLRKRLRATESLTDAQAGVINTLREELAEYATPETSAKRARMGE